MVDETKRKVLDMVEQGQVTPDEGLRLINALEGNDKKTAGSSPPQLGEVAYIPGEDGTSTPPSIPEEEMARMKKMKRWWILPFTIGLIISLMGAIWMFTGYQNNGFGWGFWLAWLPFLLGIALVAASFPTNQSVWLHVRVKQKSGSKPERINISFPIPLRFVNWFIVSFGDRIPGVAGQTTGDLTAILDDLSPEKPFYVHVEDDDGEDVEIYIG